MKENRLDGVLTRNRKHLVIDLALAGFFLMVLLFSGFAFGSELPKLSMAPQAQTAKHQKGQVALTGSDVPQANTSPQLAAR